MKILIVANFTLDMTEGLVDGRFCYLAEMLAADGHTVELITSSFSHKDKRQKGAPLQSSYKAKITYIYEPGYIKHTGLRRLWSHYIWGKNVIKYVKTLSKSDLIYCAVPSLTAPKLLASYCMKNNVKFAIDVQDLWPEATFMLLRNKMLKFFAFPMVWYVNKTYSKADYIIGVSDTYVDRAMSVNLKNPKCKTVYLGNNACDFDEAKKKYRELNKPNNEFWICYIGTLSYSYDLDCVIDAIAIVNQRKTVIKNIRFIICGDGPFRKRFEQNVKAKNILSTFYGFLPYDKMVGIMSSSDVVANCIIKDAAQSITNKVGDYALSGLPVINTQECMEYRNLVDEYSCGINCECGNSQMVADAIEELANNDEMCKIMGNNARRLGVEHFDRRHTYTQITNMFTD